MLISIQRINISEVQSGVCLFDECWKHVGSGRAEGISNLVQVFYQFAREVDEGELSRVQFRTCHVDGGSHRRRHAGDGEKAMGSTPSSSMLEMICDRGDRVIVTIFFENCRPAPKCEKKDSNTSDAAPPSEPPSPTTSMPHSSAPHPVVSPRPENNAVHDETPHTICETVVSPRDVTPTVRAQKPGGLCLEKAHVRSFAKVVSEGFLSRHGETMSSPEIQRAISVVADRDAPPGPSTAEQLRLYKTFIGFSKLVPSLVQSFASSSSTATVQKKQM
eukprot:Rmarinus@m.15883